MHSVKAIGLTPLIFMAGVLLLGASASTQSGARRGRHMAKEPRSNTTTVSGPSIPQSSSSALNEREVKRDWTAFASSTIGDAVVKDSLKQLLASGVDVNTKDKLGRTALHVAAMLGQTEMARYLLSKGADIDARDRLGRTPLMISAGLGVLHLFSGFPAPWFRFWTEPLCPQKGKDFSPSRQAEELMNWYSVAPAHRPLVQMLIDAGADVNAADGEGQTVLDYAGAGGLTDIDRLILRSGRVRGRQMCELKAAQAPALRGFRLGMSLREATASFPDCVLPDADSCGRLNISFNAADGSLRAYARRPEEFEGVTRIALTFLDGRLTYVRVTYDRATVWRNTGEYLASLSNSFRLPSSWYKAGHGMTADDAHMIGCDGFKVVAGIYQEPYAELHDTAALQAMLRRKVEEDARRRREAEEERERRRKVFKP